MGQRQPVYAKQVQQLITTNLLELLVSMLISVYRPITSTDVCVSARMRPTPHASAISVR